MIKSKKTGKFEVIEFVRQNQDMTDKRIAEIHGYSNRTIGRWRGEAGLNKSPRKFNRRLACQEPGLTKKDFCLPDYVDQIIDEESRRLRVGRDYVVIAAVRLMRGIDERLIEPFMDATTFVE